MPEISIIMPVYNVEKYLCRSVESVLNQTFRNFELILIDDGSTDRSAELCDIFGKRDARVKVVHIDNGGASAARNVGLKMAAGNFIGFVDADDWITSDMYQYLHDLILKYNMDIAACDFARDYKKIQKQGGRENLKVLDAKQMKDYFFRVNGESSNYSIWNRLYRKDIIDGITFVEEKITEDVMFNYEVTQKASGMILSDVKKYLYYKNPFGVTRSRLCQKDIDLLDIWDRIVEDEVSYKGWAELNRKRATFTLYSKALLYGHDKTISKEILKQWKQEIRAAYLELSKSPFFDWKRKAILWAINTF